MKTLYIECAMGAAGDMLLGALYELLEDKDGFLRTMNGLGLPGVRLVAKSASTCGIAGTHMAVTVDGQEAYKEDGVPQQGTIYVPLTGSGTKEVCIYFDGELSQRYPVNFDE